MAVNPYIRTTSFTQYQTETPNAPLRGQDVDTEYDDIATVTQNLSTSLARIQRDDGKLRNLSVHLESLANDTLAAIGAGAWHIRGAWATATEYAVADVVTQNEASYYCITAHTSNIFNDDADNWVVVANNAIGSANQYIATFNGGTTAYTLAFSYTDVSALSLVAVNGVIQRHTLDFTLSGTTLTFTEAPPTGTDNVLVVAAGSQFAQAVSDALAAGADAEAAALAAQTAQTGAETAETNAESSADTAQTAETNAVAAAAEATAAASGNLYSRVTSVTATDSPFTPNITDDDGVLFVVDTTGGDVVINLAEIGSDNEGKRHTFVKLNAANTITVNPGGSDTILGGTSYSITELSQFATFVADDGQPDMWVILGGSDTLAGSGLGKTGQAIFLDVTNQNDWTGPQRSPFVTDNDGSFDMDGGQHFGCTPSGDVTLQFTNVADGQSGVVVVDNSGAHTIDGTTNITWVGAQPDFTGTTIFSYIAKGSTVYASGGATV